MEPRVLDRFPPLAEYTEPTLLARELRKYETRRNTEGLFRSAWNYVECGTSLHGIDSHVHPECYFEYAQDLIGRTINHPDAHQDTILGALVLSTYLPLFVKRRAGEDVSAIDCRNVYASLGAAIEYLQPIEVDEPPQWRMAETAVLALSARTSRPDLLLYPTSPREEASDQAVVNHDSYFIDQGDKIPIQQKLIKTDQEYDEWVTVLTLQPIIERAMRKSGMRQIDNLAEQINYLFSLIVAETSNLKLSRQEIDFLNTVSAAVASHRWKKETSSRTAT